MAEATDDLEVAVKLLAERLRQAGVTVLSGAGLSTESGIPDYRGPTGALRTNTPMTYQEFVSSPAARQRYWGTQLSRLDPDGAGAPQRRAPRPKAPCRAPAPR